MMQDKVIDGVLNHFQYEHGYIEYSKEDLTKMIIDEQKKVIQLNSKLISCVARSSGVQYV